MSLKQFNRVVKSFGDRVPKEKVLVYLKKMSLEALKRIVEKTPVDTGRARGGWQVSFKTPAFSEGGTDASGAGTINTGSSQILGLKDPVAVFISNNVEYIIYLEDGTSTQAPEGMVALTIEELLGMF